MPYSHQDIQYVQHLNTQSDPKHFAALMDMVLRNASYTELFAYGAGFLPDVKNRATGKVDLEKLSIYTPEIVGYFDALSELRSLPPRLKELATNLAIYANGESLQTDAYYMSFDPKAEIEKALEEYPGP